MLGCNTLKLVFMTFIGCALQLIRISVFISIINILIMEFGYNLFQVSVGYFLADLGTILWLYPSLGGMEYVSVFTRTEGSQALILHIYYHNFFYERTVVVVPSI